jgi:hypothetical protein
MCLFRARSSAARLTGLIYEMVCRGMSTFAFSVAKYTPSPVRFAALAAAVESNFELSPKVSKLLEETPGAADEVARLADQLKVDFTRYCEAFQATEGPELLFL